MMRRKIQLGDRIGDLRPIRLVHQWHDGLAEELILSFAEGPTKAWAHEQESTLKVDLGHQIDLVFDQKTVV
jgi:hypothetical protein